MCIRDRSLKRPRLHGFVRIQKWTDQRQAWQRVLLSDVAAMVERAQAPSLFKVPSVGRRLAPSARGPREESSRMLPAHAACRAPEQLHLVQAEVLLH
eukprot:6406039-Amphidinium_carterae.1